MTTTRDITPLQMAQNCARAVLAVADYQETDPVGAHVNRAGAHGQASAQLAGNIALVSIAESLARLVELVEATGPERFLTTGPGTRMEIDTSGAVTFHELDGQDDDGGADD